MCCMLKTSEYSINFLITCFYSNKLLQMLKYCIDLLYVIIKWIEKIYIYYIKFLGNTHDRK